MADWIDNCIGGAPKDAIRRQRGERPCAPTPTCTVCGGSGWVHTRIEDGEGAVRVQCERVWPRLS